MPWWRHNMETFSAWLALCEGNLTSQKAKNTKLITFVNTTLNKQSSCWYTNANVTSLTWHLDYAVNVGIPACWLRCPHALAGSPDLGEMLPASGCRLKPLGMRLQYPSGGEELRTNRSSRLCRRTKIGSQTYIKCFELPSIFALSERTIVWISTRHIGVALIMAFRNGRYH